MAEQNLMGTMILESQSNFTESLSSGQPIRSFHRYRSDGERNQSGAIGDANGQQSEHLLPRAATFTRYFRPQRLRQDKIIVLQRWEGVVLDVVDNTMVARIRDLTTTGGDEEIEVSLDEVSESDRELAVPGGSFYWTIGYRDRIEGPRSRISEFWFRRVRTVSQSEMDEAEARSKELRDLLGW